MPLPAVASASMGAIRAVQVTRSAIQVSNSAKFIESIGGLNRNLRPGILNMISNEAADQIVKNKIESGAYDFVKSYVSSFLDTARTLSPGSVNPTAVAPMITKALEEQHGISVPNRIIAGMISKNIAANIADRKARRVSSPKTGPGVVDNISSKTNDISSTIMDDSGGSPESVKRAATVAAGVTAMPLQYMARSLNNAKSLSQPMDTSIIDPVVTRKNRNKGRNVGVNRTKGRTEMPQPTGIGKMLKSAKKPAMLAVAAISAGLLAKEIFGGQGYQQELSNSNILSPIPRMPGL